ncbi:glutathione S-transferase family protein [Labrys neptuniae]
MADYKLYAFGESGNCYKVAMMLALTGTPWERLPVDFFNGETRSDAFRAINEMGEAPVLLHDGKVLTQSGVILDYLAEQTGKFGPENADERREILRWILFDNHKFTSYYASLRFLTGLMKKEESPVTEFLRARAKGAFAIVDKHLATNDFLVGNRLTIADLSLAGYVFFEEETGLPFSDYANILAWRGRIAAMPGWKPPYEMVPHAPPMQAR